MTNFIVTTVTNLDSMSEQSEQAIMSPYSILTLCQFYEHIRRNRFRKSVAAKAVAYPDAPKASCTCHEYNRRNPAIILPGLHAHPLASTT
jgi:hypothetical protein